MEGKGKSTDTLHCLIINAGMLTTPVMPTIIGKPLASKLSFTTGTSMELKSLYDILTSFKTSSDILPGEYKSFNFIL